jgi:Uma2 family endonuclease
MSTAQIAAEQRFVLDGVDWRMYSRWLLLVRDRPAVRLTYDRGTLEIMTLSHEHESWEYFMARLIDALTEELGLPVKGGGSTTFRRRKQKRGLEPDACWWIANEALVRGKARINLRTDPPPDLALEIDITHSSLNRMAIYAALRVPEVWRFRNQVLTFYVLGADGKYAVSTTSRAFPLVSADDMSRFLPLADQLDVNAVVRQFRVWVRQRMAASGFVPPAP